MADTIVTIDRLQVRRSSTPGYRPGQNGTRPLADGEEFVNFADGVRLSQDGGTTVEYPLRPSIDDVPGAGGAAKADVATDEEAADGIGSGLLSAAQTALQISERLTLSQALANGTGTLTADLLGSLVNLGNIVLWGASPIKSASQNTDAIQACFDWCRDTNSEYLIPQGMFPVNHGLKVWTGGRCLGALVAQNVESGFKPVVEVVPLPADLVQVPISFFNGTPAIAKGLAEHADFAPFYGCMLYWQTTDQKMINHPDGVHYALADSVVVHDPSGKIFPAVSWTKDRNWTNVRAFAETLRAPIDVQMNIRWQGSGAGLSAGGVTVSRSNVRVYSSECINETPNPVHQGFRSEPTFGVVFDNCTMEGARELNTNYGFQAITTIGLTLRNCDEIWCRRGFDGNENSRLTTIEGGSYLDGVGGHLCYGLFVGGGAFVSADNPNTAPLFMSGGDLIVDESVTVRVPPELGSAFAIRGDALEFRGRLIVRGRVEIDCTGTNAIKRVLIVGGSGLPAEYNIGREVSFPHYIELSGEIAQIGPMYTGTIEMLRLFDNTSSYSSPVRAGGRAVISPTLLFESGLYVSANIPRAQVITYKYPKQWTQGEEYDVLLGDMPAVLIRSLCSADRTDNSQRINLKVRNVGFLRHQLAPGAYRLVDINAETIFNPVGSTASRDLAFRTTLAGDERESRNSVQIVRIAWQPASLTAGQSAEVDVDMFGAQPNDVFRAALQGAQGTGWDIKAAFLAANRVRVRLTNNNGTTQTLPSTTLTVFRQLA